MNALLNGLVLAGGRSSRMGEDKSTLRFHNMDQTHYLAALLAPFVKQVFVSIRPEQQSAAQFSDMDCITDRYRSPSPLNGIASAMRRYPAAGWLVAAVDMPNIIPETLQALLIGRNTSAIATCFESPAKGGPDPLLAIWEAHGFSEIDAALGETDQHICPRQFLKHANTHILRQAVSPDALTNINTPEERDACLRKAS